jgi:RHS repeat-associated protein
VITTRGFTGHEHVDSTGLIHMNARLYDPQLGRFLQPDPIIQDLLNAQNLNRYSYVLNNPLSLTDPSGASWFSKYWRSILSLAINIFLPGAGAFWGALGVSTGSLASSIITGFISGVVASGSLKGGLWGAFSAGLFFKIGDYFRGADWTKASSGTGVLKTGLNAGGYAAKVLSHGVAGGVMQSLQGGKFGHGFVSAGVAQAASGMIDGIDPSNLGFSPSRTFAAAMLGGSVSAATGGKFASGAATAAFSRAFNDEQHRRSAFKEYFESVGDVLGEYAEAANNFITSESVVNGVAGAGDAASFGLSKVARDLNGWGAVDTNSGAYTAGAVASSLVVPTARVSYMIQASRLGRGLAPTLANAASVSAQRAALKAYYRGGNSMPTLRRILESRDRSYDQLMRRYNGDAGAIMAAATRTNNTYSAAMIAIPLHSAAVSATRYASQSNGN